MRAAIVNPYFDTLGGGERYSASVASVLLKAGYLVDIQWEDQNLAEKISTRFGIDITKANIIKSVNRGDGYDVCFWISDGSIPTLRSRKNILHFQVPFSNVDGKSLMNRMKLFRVRSVVCNSDFTKSIIDREYGVQSVVLYPPIDIRSFKPKRKENIILYVGRFSSLLQSKGQEVLLEAYKKLYDGGLKDWKLIFAGGSEVGADKVIVSLRKAAQGYPVTFVLSPNFNTLTELYGKAKLFWSASGYGVDEKTDPQRVEHFGMAPVEAMSAGVVPILVAKGGHREIIQDEINGYLWKSTDELISVTEQLISSNKLSAAKRRAIISAKKYSNENFEKTLLSLL